jgi:hypothetical protein
MCEREVPGGALNLGSTSYPDHGRCGDLALQRKIPTEEPGIESGTLWLVFISSDRSVFCFSLDYNREQCDHLIDQDLEAALKALEGGEQVQFVNKS